jgi:soluble epoxide hydrolase / lipid-phosphate phosphatase
MPSIFEVTSQTVETAGHTTSYLACGPEKGPLVVFVHGWPELSISWRHQLPALGALGFRAVAPDMRGYGRSSVYPERVAYAQEPIVGDMLGLLAALGRERAVWVGHDWGSPVVWNLASHHPERCVAVANLCVPYGTLERSWEATIALVDRDVYPEDRFPVGQWDYQLYYQEHFERATAVMDANPYNLVKALFRKGNPSQAGQPALTGSTRAMGGWFGGADEAPDIRPDHDVVSDEDLATYAEALGRNGFAGPNAWYMNHEVNAGYAERSVAGGRLDLPVLFLGARYDYTCETATSRLAEPMRRQCTNLTEHLFDCGHWMAQEKPREVNAALVDWLARRVADAWPLPQPAAAR